MAITICCMVIPLLFMPVSGALAKSPMDFVCPKRISQAVSSLKSNVIDQAVRDIYKQLGCATEFVRLPPRRAIAEFNKGLIDGEVLRLDVVEEHYTVEFVRSATPLVFMSNSLWVHPDENVRRSRPLGYVMGVIWQEQFMKGKNGISFYNRESTLNAYNNGVISGFPIGDVTISLKIKRGELIPPPVSIEPVFSAPLFHYVHRDYSDFMAVFSDFLLKNKPFANIEATLYAGASD
ncbi:MAG: hypothetical protein ISR47_09395 [Rhodospirillales bacterium]|nr:hypothetical protein [Rhodospirillales bacterium]